MPFSVLQRTRDVNIVTGSRKSTVYPMHFRGYGLGVYAADYNGRQIYWHTGGAAGMVSNVCFVPEEKLGIAILTNNDNQGFFEALRYQVLDAYLDVKDGGNRSEQMLKGFQNGMREQLAEIEAWKARLKNNKPALPINAYAGNYANELYGNLQIQVRDNRLVLRFNSHKNLSATLDYMDDGEWLLRYDNIEYGIYAIRFDMKEQKVASVKIRFNDFVEYDPYTFLKQE
jgi:hypothetical protein